MASKKRETKEIPQLRTEEEEAEFWANHSPLDFADEIEQVDVKVKKPLKSVLAIRLDDEYQKELREIARHCGVGPTTMARMFIVSSINAYRNGSLRRPLPTGFFPQSDVHQNMSIKRVAGLFKGADASRLWEETKPLETHSISLSPVEIRLLHLILDGMSNGEMARELSLPESATEEHLRNMLGKLGLLIELEHDETRGLRSPPE